MMGLALQSRRGRASRVVDQLYSACITAAARSFASRCSLSTPQVLTDVPASAPLLQANVSVN